jgi:hypothetical protein
MCRYNDAVTNATPPAERYFAHFVTTRDDEGSLRTLIDLPASADEIAGICTAEGVGATLLDLEGRSVGHVDERGQVTLSVPMDPDPTR